MRRQLTTREWMLLALLGVILLISGYMLLFYMPQTAERDRCLGETESCRMEIEAAQLHLEEKRRMERELEALFSSETPPLSIADYDNLQPVMFELNSILASTEDYSLSFSTVDTSQAIVRRSISISVSIVYPAVVSMSPVIAAFAPEQKAPSPLSSISPLPPARRMNASGRINR